jgi:hypothetical protein
MRPSAAMVAARHKAGDSTEVDIVSKTTLANFLRRRNDLPEPSIEKSLVVLAVDA